MDTGTTEPNRPAQGAASAPIDRLRRTPEAFGFFQAVRMIYRAEGFDARGNASRPGPLRFSTPASLAFPASELLSLDDDGAGGWRMCVQFLGLTGPAGILPRHYTEQLIARQQARDRATQDFLDLFNHRLLALFWQAWAKYRPDIGREFGFRNTPLHYVHHLVGLGTPALQRRLLPARRGDAEERTLPGAATAYFAGLISQRPHGAGALSQVVGQVAGAPVTITGCLGTWMTIPARDRTRIGAGASRLGDGCVLGPRYWDRQTSLQLSIGPLDAERFHRLLPDAGRLHEMVELARFLIGMALDLHIRLLLDARQVPPLRMGERGPSRPRLGWNTWLSGRRDARPADQCRFRFSATGGPSWH